LGLSPQTGRSPEPSNATPGRPEAFRTSNGRAASGADFWGKAHACGWVGGL